MTAKESNRGRTKSQHQEPKTAQFRIKTLKELVAAGWMKVGCSNFGHITVEIFRHTDGSEVCLPGHRDLGDVFTGRAAGDIVHTDLGGQLPLSFVIPLGPALIEPAFV